MKVAQGLNNLWVWLEMELVGKVRWNRFKKLLSRPQKVQDDLLRRILRANQETRFGRRYDFAKMDCYEKFMESVPVASFEDLRPYIESQRQSQRVELTVSPPEIYMQTSGTTGEPKNIPVNDLGLAQFEKTQSLFAYSLYREAPRVYSGGVLAVGSPLVEGHLDCGAPFGSMSGLFCRNMPTSVRKKYVVPQAVFELADYREKYLLLAAYCLRCQDLTLMGGANPSTFLKILEVIEEEWQPLLDFLESGDPVGLKLTTGEAQRLGEVFPADPKRAATLKTLSPPLSFASLWPGLQVISTWTGGSCAVLISRLKKLIAPHTRIIELGYLSSEFRGSLPVGRDHSFCVPTLQENFFEFADPGEWDTGERRTIPLCQVEEGRSYYVIVTTVSGLYRYFINDVVEIGPKFRATPTLRFLQKGKGMCNLTGEKISEAQVRRALELIRKQEDIEFEFYIVLGDPETLQYTLFVEADPVPGLATRFDSQLAGLNVEFQAKQRSGRLKPTRVVFLRPRTREAYKEYCIDNGQRESQFKIVPLLTVADCRFNFFEHECQ